jgi:hypothetical protein
MIASWPAVRKKRWPGGNNAAIDCGGATIESMRALVRAAAWGVAVFAAAGCTGQSAQLARPRPAHSARPVSTSQCRVSPVHTGPLPSALPGQPSAPASARRQGSWPWMGETQFAAVLFYARGGNPLMFAGGQMPNGNITKVLWWVARQRTGPLVIHGREASSGHIFTQSIGLGVGQGLYPSQTVVPGAGCWTLTVTIGGDKVGAITVPVAAAAAGT